MNRPLPTKDEAAFAITGYHFGDSMLGAALGLSALLVAFGICVRLILGWN